MSKLSRRHFLQLLAASPLMSVGQISWASSKEEQQGTPKANDNESINYKALVCLQLVGGNDSWNMIFPMGDDSTHGKGHGYQTYAARRGGLAIAQETLQCPEVGHLHAANGHLPYTARSIGEGYLKGGYPLNGQWALHGCMPELAWLQQAGQLDCVINTGVLAAPVTRETLNTAELPLFLYAHDHQQRALALADATQVLRTGWGGRLADYWQSKGQYQTAHPLGKNIAVGRSSATLVGETPSELVLPAGRPITLWGAKRGQMQQRLTTLNQPQAGEGLSAIMANRQQEAINLAAMLSEQWGTTADYSKLTGPAGEAFFTLPPEATLGLDTNMQGYCMKQLETVARMIEIGKRDGLQRQLFVVTMPGFDTHDDQAPRHATLLRELSLSLWHFQQAMAHLGLTDNVTVFTQSDFGRTLMPNNAGTDHGWGGNQIIMGAAATGSILGNCPDLRQTSNAMAHDQRGRVIPTIASEQVTAHLLHWMGVPQQDLPQMLPHLRAFPASLTDATFT